jgi:hypothetical protein
MRWRSTSSSEAWLSPSASIFFPLPMPIDPRGVPSMYGAPLLSQIAASASAAGSSALSPGANIRRAVSAPIGEAALPMRIGGDRIERGPSIRAGAHQRHIEALVRPVYPERLAEWGAAARRSVCIVAVCARQSSKPSPTTIIMFAPSADKMALPLLCIWPTTYYDARWVSTAVKETRKVRVDGEVTDG